MKNSPLVSAAAALAKNQAHAALAARLDGAIELALAEQRIVGTVVLVARDGQRVYQRAAGWADREARTPMADNALFLLASLTKPIVSTTALRLVEQGRLRLDDPVTRWLPDFRPAFKREAVPITLHQLLTHSAGLSYDFMQPEDGPYTRLAVSNGLNRPEVGLDENLRRISAAGLAYAPGSGWGYSVAIDVLGAVIERVTGLALPEAVRQAVSAPLALRDTGFEVRDRQRLATFYGDGQPVPVRMQAEHTVPYLGAPVHFSPGRVFDPRAYPSGGAGMVGTAAEMLQVLEALRTERLVSPATWAAMRHPHIGAEVQTRGPGWGFGYGGALLIDPAAADSPQSAGTLQWGGAYGHHWFIDTASKLSVVAMTNTAFEGMSGAYTREVRDAVYGR
jgi:CubicO group peptidase (beta-lactamase class C family)